MLRLRTESGKFFEHLLNFLDLLDGLKDDTK